MRPRSRGRHQLGSLVAELLPRCRHSGRCCPVLLTTRAEKRARPDGEIVLLETRHSRWDQPPSARGTLVEVTCARAPGAIAEGGDRGGSREGGGRRADRLARGSRACTRCYGAESVAGVALNHAVALRWRGGRRGDEAHRRPRRWGASGRLSLVAAALRSPATARAISGGAAVAL